MPVIFNVPQVTVFPSPTFLLSNVHLPLVSNPNVTVSPCATPDNVPKVQVASVVPLYSLFEQLDIVGVNCFLVILQLNVFAVVVPSLHA